MRLSCGCSFMGPILFSSLWALIIWGFIQLFFRPGPVGQMIYALLGAFIFSGYIVYDTYLLLARALHEPTSNFDYKHEIVESLSAA